MKTKISVLLSALLLLIVSGCNTQSKLDYVNNAHQLAFGTNVCTLIVSTGQVDMPTAAVIGTTVHAAHNCSVMWYDCVKDGNSPPPDVVLCATTAVLDLLAYQKEYNVDVPAPAMVKDVNDADVEIAKAGLDMAVIRFDKAMENAFKP